MTVTCLAPKRPITKRNKAYRGQIKAQIFESLVVALVSMASKAGEVLYKVKVEGGGGTGGGGSGTGDGGGGGGIKEKDGDGSD